MNRKTSYYLIGICGIGMSSLAQLIQSRGFKVRGSDASPDVLIERKLSSLGIEVYFSHEAGRIRESDIVVYSTAVGKSNPEYIEAKGKNCVLLHRTSALVEMLKDRKSIAVTGTHGKTTMTYLLASVLRNYGFDSGMILGGISKEINNNFIPSNSNYILELDESDRSFQILDSDLKVFTSLGNDHLEFYNNDFSELKREFRCYMQKEGVNIISADDNYLVELAEASSLKYLSFGFGPKADYRGELVDKGDFFSKIKLYKNGSFITEYTLPLIGYKNASNSLAVFALADILKLDLLKIAESFSGLSGIERRYDLKFCSKAVTLMEDYAHHPREIEEAIRTVKEYLKPPRILVVFQPHRYTRTEMLWDDYKTCFKGGDKIYISDIYSAFEEVIPSINSEMLVENIGSSNVKYAKIDEIADLLLNEVREGDMILLLGAGDINKISKRLSEGLSSIE
ncbi:MAG: UDP-N-acetylmuramate--L-alanine ligase [Candidatus Kaelpia imicola]|nr:UDP-N-acetylmuramate--L-alanine ligase [Candidatus Kaelpia imicola]